MTALGREDHDVRWEPALVRRVLFLRGVSAIAIGVAAAMLPSLGPDRFLLATLLIGPIAIGAFVTPMVIPLDRALSYATTVDMAWTVVIAFLMPEVLAACMIVAISMLAFIANDDTRALFVATGICVVGFSTVGVVHGPELWLVHVIVFILLLPMLLFVSITQGERERRQQRKNHHRAEHDPLTGLRNRAGLAASIVDMPVEAVVAVDLDGFKDINDTLGHEAGDELLVALAARMNAAVGTKGVLARTGGDEFTIIVRHGDPDSVAGDVLRACRYRFPLGDVDVSVGASVGVAFGEPGVETTELIRRADFAMYEAKRTRVGVRRWSGRTGSTARQRVSLSGDVESGFEDGQFKLFFQPIVELETGRVVDVEGLLRWRHPEHGILQPADFLPLVEGIGLRSTMDRTVFDQAAALAKTLQPRNIGVSVNVSARSLLRSSVPEVLADALRRHDVVPQRITVEVIEDELVDDSSTARAVLEALGELGVGIAIDDFGTGHSSLARLRRLPVSSLKIDRCFVSAMLESEDDESIVSAVCHLGRALDLIVVAEGVEDLAIRDHLVHKGYPVDRLQGYGIARPLPVDELLEWIAERSLLATPAPEGQLSRRTRAALDRKNFSQT